MEFRTHFASMSATVLAFVGTTTFVHANHHDTADFARELSGQYRALAAVERASGDFRDARRYADRADAAAAGKPAGPTEVSARSAFLKQHYVGDLTQARERLAVTYERNAQIVAPASTARAESSYECWLEQAAEDLQPDHISACRESFLAAVGETEKILDTPVAVTEPPPPPAPTPSPEIYRVYFDFNKSSLNAAARAVLERVRSNYDSVDRARIEAIGWADTVGSDSYNLTLSRKRADTIKRGLVDLGIPPAAISTTARGEEDLPQPTADGVREPRNRQVEVTVNPGE